MGTDGTVTVDGVLDVADGLDLDSNDSLDVRRSKAAGELARHDQKLDYSAGENDEDEAVVSRLAGARTSTTGADPGG